MKQAAMLLAVAAGLFAPFASAQTAPPPDDSAYILTPPPPHTPRINGARVYGGRPGRPFLFTVPASGDDPLSYTAKGLPKGLILDRKTGRITGSVTQAGSYKVTLTAANALGRDSRPLRIEIGDQVALTPPMGWNTYNALGNGATAAQVLAQARAMASSGLVRHGWTYINVDDAWQGARTGPDHAMQANADYPDMKGMTDEIHALGLKVGLYSTPWTTSYGGNPGETSENPAGAWSPPTTRVHFDGLTMPWAIGPYHFEAQDARQFAAWGFDYFKYDWFPNGVPETQQMKDALTASGRDFVFSLSNTAPFEHAADWARLANAWRTTGDIRDSWRSLGANGFSQDPWAPFAGPGHWNDPDMLVVGVTGGWASGGASKPRPGGLRPSRLSPDEQYTHISLWCLLAAPLLLGCDLTKLDPFTLSLLTNDEVLAIDQDPLGREARRVAQDTATQTEVWARPLADGTLAVGLFNRSDAPAPVSAAWTDLHLTGPQSVRDLWRQKDLGPATGPFTATVSPHGVLLVKIGTPSRLAYMLWRPLPRPLSVAPSGSLPGLPALRVCSPLFIPLRRPPTGDGAERLGAPVRGSASAGEWTGERGRGRSRRFPHPLRRVHCVYHAHRRTAQRGSQSDT